MGSIIYCEKRPNRWTAYEDGTRLKETGEPLVFVEYGSYDDYPDGETSLTMYMRKSIYEGAVNNLYRIDFDYIEQRLKLYDKKTGNYIPAYGRLIY